MVKLLNALGQSRENAGLVCGHFASRPAKHPGQLLIGIIYLNRKQFGKAARYFERVVSLYSLAYDTSLSLAWTYLTLSKKAEARALYNTVLLIWPNDTNALAGLKRL